MKKQTPSSFVICYNDIYVFAEGKKHALYGPMYNVYYSANENPTRFSAENFYKTHGAHEKKSVYDFLNNAKLNLTTLGKRNNDIDETFDIFTDSLKEIEKDNLKHPKFKKMKNYFLMGLEKYNYLVSQFLQDPEISYIEEFNRLNKRQTMQEVKNISFISGHNEDKALFDTNEYDQIKGIQRIKKYE